MLERLLFAIRHRTLRPVAWRPSRPGVVSVFHRGKVVELPRRCPHQGAPLEEGCVAEDALVCPWHGCRFSLLGEGPPRPHEPTR